MNKNISLYLCTVGGALIVSFYELIFNNNNSLVIKIGEGIRQLLFKGWEQSAWAGMIAVVLFACYCHHISSPKSKKAAAKIGLGIISVIATFASPLSKSKISNFFGSISLIEIAYAQQSTSGALELKLSDVEPNQALNIEVRDGETDKIVFVKSTADGTVSVKDLEKSKVYNVYIEGSGLRWTKMPVKITDNTALLDVSPQKSSIPIVIQKFFGAKTQRDPKAEK